MAFFSSILKFNVPVIRQCTRTVLSPATRQTLVPTGSFSECQTRRLFYDSRLHDRCQLFGSRSHKWCLSIKTVQNNTTRPYFTHLTVEKYGQRQFNINLINKRFKSEDAKPENNGERKLSVFQRFKAAYKEQGKILIGVHLATSVVWFGLFFVAASKGIDIIPLLEWLGLSETIIKPFRNPSLGNLAMAYLIYEVMKPVRFTATLAGTNIVIKHMRKTGRLPPQKEKIKKLVKDGKKSMLERTPKITDFVQGKLKEGTGKMQGKLKEGPIIMTKRVRARLTEGTKKITKRVRIQWTKRTGGLRVQFKGIMRKREERKIKRQELKLKDAAMKKPGQSKLKGMASKLRSQIKNKTSGRSRGGSRGSNEPPSVT